jgi:hypothetical protein
MVGGLGGVVGRAAKHPDFRRTDVTEYPAL